MFNKLEIRNFRCLKEVDIGKLRPVNLIAGQNNVGKTSLLEAIFLLSGCANPDMARHISINRGIAGFPVSSETIVDFLGKPLFSDFDINKTISLSTRAKRLGPLKLEIHVSQAETTSIGLNGEGHLSATGLPDRHRIESVLTRGKQEVRSHLQYEEDGQIQYHHSGSDILFKTWYLCPHSGNINEDASRLGQLRTHKKGDYIHDYPKLKKINENQFDMVILCQTLPKVKIIPNI